MNMNIYMTQLGVIASLVNCFDERKHYSLPRNLKEVRACIK
jgi:hypothetical protein